ncbi:hypothetical protein LCGC14_1425920 [marine sediment metagenome]|uniref:Uncharacterized protein n=1 Tax=marine sediment metagenome TaxID=412755 RepID=A0A0F9M5I3_9ZZZZ
MEVPILLGANPKTSNPSMWIPIRFGRWFVRVEGLIDSELSLYSNGPFKNRVKITLPAMNGAVYMGPCQVRAEFVKRGTERAVSIFAEEHHAD